VTSFKDLQESEDIRHFTLEKEGTEQEIPKSHT